jgi:hypothetical protein
MKVIRSIGKTLASLPAVSGTCRQDGQGEAEPTGHNIKNYR